MEEEGEIEDAEPVCKFINRGPPFAKALDGEDHWDDAEKHVFFRNVRVLP